MPILTHHHLLDHARETRQPSSWFLGLTLLLAVAGCGDPPESESAADTAGPAVAAITSSAGVLRIEMRDDMTFVPPSATVAVGDTIVWSNVGGMPHTSTNQPNRAALPEHALLPAGAEGWDSGALPAGGEMRVVLTVPGEYTYYCSLHEALGMVATLTVR